MIRARWEQLVIRVDAMSLRERVLIFSAAAFLLVSLINALFLNPLLEQQKKLSLQVILQQEKMKEVQAQLDALVQAKRADASSPVRDRIRLVQQQIREGEIYLKNRRDKLVPPEKMGDLLEQVLGKNGRLQLVALETLAVTPFVEAPAAGQEKSASPARQAEPEKQMYKHGVRITVRGSYADLRLYLEALERLPTQMFWGPAKMSVIKHPTAELTLTLYTLSLDTIWLQV